MRPTAHWGTRTRTSASSSQGRAGLGKPVCSQRLPSYFCILKSVQSRGNVLFHIKQHALRPGIAPFQCYAWILPHLPATEISNAFDLVKNVKCSSAYSNGSFIHPIHTWQVYCWGPKEVQCRVRAHEIYGTHWFVMRDVLTVMYWVGTPNNCSTPEGHVGSRPRSSSVLNWHLPQAKLSSSCPEAGELDQPTSQGGG